jgi:hypothetical protein
MFKHLLVSIDSGAVSGWGVFREGLLIAAGIHAERFRFPDGSDLVIEVPRIYPFKGKGDQNDLIKTAFRAGRLSARWREEDITETAPRTWKGNVNKDLMVERVKEFLRPEELLIVPSVPESYAHNMWDGIGLGLFHLGRMGCGGR